MSWYTHLLSPPSPLLRAALWAMVGSACVLQGVALAQTSGAMSSVAGVYTCIDAHGRRLTADRPIPQCVDREQRELSPLGNVRRVIGPTLTEHEKAALEAQRRKEQEERAQVAEERRRERVLTSRYPNQVAHDAERAEAIVQIEAVSSAAAKRIIELKEQRKALDAEMEFYRRDTAKAPMSLRRMIAENDASVQEQQRFIANQEREKRRVHQRFDVELVQLRQLWLAQRGPLVPLPPSAGAPPVGVPGMLAGPGAVFMTPKPLGSP